MSLRLNKIVKAIHFNAEISIPSIYPGLRYEDDGSRRIEALVRPTAEMPEQCSYAFVNCLPPDLTTKLEDVPLYANEDTWKYQYTDLQKQLIEFFSKLISVEQYDISDPVVFCRSGKDQLGQVFHKDNYKTKNSPESNYGIIFMVHLGLSNARNEYARSTVDSTQFSMEEDPETRYCTKIGKDGKPTDAFDSVDGPTSYDVFQYITSIKTTRSFVSVHSPETCHRGISRRYPVVAIGLRRNIGRHESALQIHKYGKYLQGDQLSHDIDVVAHTWLEHM